MAARSELSLVLAFLVAFPLASVARADAVGDATVVAMDAAINRAATLIFDYEIFNQEPDKPERMLTMTVQVKGSKRLYEFTSPPDMKGTQVLVLSPTQMYVYLPAFGRVRRIVSQTKEQGFLGLAFSQDDLAITSYGLQYAGRIVSQTPTQHVLVLTPKAGQETTYARIEITIVKDRMLPLQLKYFNSEGANIKTETRSGYTCEGTVCTPRDIKMVDNTKRNSTRFVRKSWKQNVAISDDVFSQRNLGPR